VTPPPSKCSADRGRAVPQRDPLKELNSKSASHQASFNVLFQEIMAGTKQNPRKRKSSEYAADDGFMNDNDGNDSHPIKRAKSRSTRLQAQIDTDGNTFWEISKMRRVTVSEFKGRQMVSVREYYEQNGEMKPGKKVWKGIQKLALAVGCRDMICREKWMVETNQV
jgi:hypothetical protein